MGKSLPQVNNLFYDDLGDRWYKDDTHPVALLRVEGHAKLAYIESVFENLGLPSTASILDIGCGAGLISNPLARKGYRVTGLDIAGGAIATANRFKPQGSRVEYTVGDAYQLPYPSESFDVVMMLDFLEHVEDADRSIAEASRVLRQGGIFIFHTFNRTLLAYLLVIKAVELFTKQCPKHMHVLHLFRSPQEVVAVACKHRLMPHEVVGIRPKFESWPFWLSVFRRRLHPKFSFTIVKSTSVGYLGYATRA